MQAALDPEQTPITLANPLSAEMSVMRTSIWPGLVKSLIYNVNRQQARVRLFESGLCFSQLPNQAGLAFDNISQIKKLAGVVCGPRQDENWSNDPQLVDFYDVKGDIESVLALTGQAGTFEFVAGRPIPRCTLANPLLSKKTVKPSGMSGFWIPEFNSSWIFASQYSFLN